MSVVTLVQGMAALFAFLAVAGLLGGIGPVELLIWLGLVAAWIAYWTRRRKRRTA